MGRWRTKILHSLILFSAGFATAVYVLAPPGDGDEDITPAAARGGKAQADTDPPGSGAHDRAAQWRAGMDKAVSFAEDNAVRAFRAAKLQFETWQRQHGQ